jgi:hypothetical protein
MLDASAMRSFRIALRISQSGGKRARRSRLGKDRSPHQPLVHCESGMRFYALLSRSPSD